MAGELEVYLDGLFARARPSTLVEVRWRAPGVEGMRRRFVPAGRLAEAARVISRLGGEHDVFVGVLPRWRRGGRRADVVGDGRTLWVDLDVPDGLRVLEPVDPPPSLLVASGTPGHVHAYWRLARALAPRQVERANGRLAYALSADLSSRDAGRILRPPGTRNVGRDANVRLLSGHDGAVLPGDLVGGLEDPPGWQPPRRGPARARVVGAAGLDAVAPEVYVERLTGLRVGRSRKVRCPLHPDGTPSLHVYPEVGRGWYCYGCAAGGDVFDLAGALWGRETSGAGFLALRADLEHVLLG